MDIITRKKVQLIRWLPACEIVLQHAQSKYLITFDEYTRLKEISDRGTQMTELLDLMLRKGQDVCVKFLELLKEDDVNKSSPELKKWITSLSTSELKAASAGSVQSSGCSVTISATGANLFTPIISSSQISSLNMNMNLGPQKQSDEKPVTSYDRSLNNNLRFPDNEELLRKNRGKLIEKVKNVDRIIDDLTILDGEKAANVRAERTDQAKMRKVLEYTNSRTAVELLLDALYIHAADVMKDLTTA